MQLHELQPKQNQRTKKRVGRGGKRGTYSGRGIKGQKARAGARFQPRVREIIKKYPKLRGYRTRPLNNRLVSINVDVLEKSFSAGDVVTPAALVEKNIVATIKGRTPMVKILGTGTLTKAFTIEQCAVSKTAKERIEKAGGTVVETKSNS